MDPLTIERWNHYPADLEQFNKDTANHEMTVAIDADGYRHLQFRDPERGLYWFDILAWPGNLTITGDMGTYTFRRETDMFAWFGIRNINPDYWAEKLTAANYGRYDGGSVRAYNATEFKKWLFQTFWDDSRDMEPTEAKAAWKLIRETIFEGWMTNNKYTPDSENEAVERMEEYHSDSPGHEFYDWHDAIESWQEFTVHFLWCCHAIVAAIRAYNAHKG